MSALRDRIIAEIAERERWLPVVAYADEASKQRARKRRHEFDLSAVELQEIAAALERQGERVVLEPVGEPSIPKQEIRRAVSTVAERQGEVGMVQSPAYCSQCCVICRADTTGVLANRCYMCGGPMVHIPDTSPQGER